MSFINFFQIMNDLCLQLLKGTVTLLIPYWTNTHVAESFNGNFSKKHFAVQSLAVVKYVVPKSSHFRICHANRNFPRRQRTSPQPGLKSTAAEQSCTCRWHPCRTQPRDIFAPSRCVCSVVVIISGPCLILSDHDEAWLST